jgi:hypothetical protein
MTDIDDLIGYTQARVIVRATPSELLALAKDRAPDPSIFDQFPPFIWLNEISSDRLDAYFTVMDAETTLPNYARDAAAGVAVLIGHNTRELPIGYSLTGTLEHTGDVTRVLSDAYALQDAATAPVINRVRAGIVRDDSVGFSYAGAQCICSICNRDMWRDWKCWHIPGMRYKRTDNPEDAVSDPNGELATGRIVNAHLAEYSLVYDGATPGAAVLQAQRAAEAGRITTEQARLIEQRYRINLPGKRLAIQGATMPPENNGKDVSHTSTAAPAAAPLERAIQQTLERVGAPNDLLIPAGVEWLADELARLTPLAKDGEQYRKDLIETAEQEAVRALGAEAGAAQRAMLEAAPIALIKSFTTSWRAIGDASLKGGRLTAEKSDDEPEPAAWKKVESSHLHG